MPLTPVTLTRCLAYIHHYTPPVLAGRCLSPTHLRRLAQWIETPKPAMRSLRTHPLLAIHIALLQGAGLITAAEEAWLVAPTATAWLQAMPAEQLAPFLLLLDSPNLWEQTVARLGLQHTLSCDYLLYVRQMLTRQSEVPPVTPVARSVALAEPAYWLEGPADTAWRLCLPVALPGWLLFDLLQLGEWQPGAPLCCTPLSITAAARRGYGAQHIRWLLETATQQLLPDRYQAALKTWLGQGRAYQLRQVHLLATAQPAQLQALLAQKRWRPHIRQQIGARHAVVSADLIPHLRRWLAKKGYALDDATTIPEQTQTFANSAAYHWLGLRVLLGLGELMPLPYPPPHAQLDSLDSQLTSLEESELEAVAQSVVDNLRAAIRGRDAFWPAQGPVPAEWLDCIKQAIESEQHLDIFYQTPAETRPGYRRIQPLRLYQRGALHCLHAYCYRVEMNVDFRVDRIKEILRG